MECEPEELQFFGIYREAARVRRAPAAAFALLFAYHFVFVVLPLLAADSGSGLVVLTAFLLAIGYLAGLVYLSVVSALEDYKGLDAMRKS